MATAEVWVTVLVQWSENRVSTSPSNWKLPVRRNGLLLPEPEPVEAKPDMPPLVLPSSVRDLGELSTTNRNSVNCFSVYCVLSPWEIKKSLNWWILCSIATCVLTRKVARELWFVVKNSLHYQTGELFFCVLRLVALFLGWKIGAGQINHVIPNLGSFGDKKKWQHSMVDQRGHAALWSQMTKSAKITFTLWLFQSKFLQIHIISFSRESKRYSKFVRLLRWQWCRRVWKSGGAKCYVEAKHMRGRGASSNGGTKICPPPLLLPTSLDEQSISRFLKKNGGRFFDIRPKCVPPSLSLPPPSTHSLRQQPPLG